MRYDATYDNSIDASPTYRAYLDERGRAVLPEVNTEARVLEIGCGKGTFLRQLVETHPRSSGLGVDATYEGELADLNGRLHFERRYFSAADAGRRIDAAVCRHVIEHVADPMQFLRDIRVGLAGSPDVHVFFETPSFEWIVEQTTFWDVFYEHCNYFTGPALSRAFESAGFAIAKLERVFGGQFWWIEATLASERNHLVPPAALFSDIIRFGLRTTAALDRLRGNFAEKHSHGAIALWGAAAKGTTLANLLDPDAHIIAALVDLNPRKQGCFVGGSGHPIESPQCLVTRAISTTVVVNPLYLAENTAIARRIGSRSQLMALG